MSKYFNVWLDIISKFLLFILMFGFFTVGMVFFMRGSQDKEDELYKIVANGTTHWAKEIKILPNGQLEFYDVEWNRTVIINDKYVIYNPKNK